MFKDPDCSAVRVFFGRDLFSVSAPVQELALALTSENACFASRFAIDEAAQAAIRSDHAMTGNE